MEYQVGEPYRIRIQISGSGDKTVVDNETRAGKPDQDLRRVFRTYRFCGKNQHGVHWFREERRHRKYKPMLSLTATEVEYLEKIGSIQPA